MKRSIVLAWAAWAVVTGGCHTTQPQQRGSANVLLRLNTTGTAIGWWVYNQRIGGPDRPTSPPAHCVVAQDAGGQGVAIPDAILPWPVAVQISVFHNGVPSVVEGGTPLGDVIAQTSGFSTITGYDSSPVPATPAAPALPPLGQTYFTDGHLASSASREYYERCSPSIPWPVPDPSIYGPVQVLFQTTGSPTYTLNLTQGDTLIVKAQKQGNLETLYTVGKDALLTGELLVDGAVKASAVSTVDSGSGIVLTYTLP